MDGDWRHPECYRRIVVLLPAAAVREPRRERRMDRQPDRACPLSALRSRLYVRPARLRVLLGLLAPESGLFRRHVRTAAAEACRKAWLVARNRPGRCCPDLPAHCADAVG